MRLKFCRITYLFALQIWHLRRFGFLKQKILIFSLFLCYTDMNEN